MKPNIKFKHSDDISIWLCTALEFEWKKYETNPITRDIVRGYNYSQAWGFIVAGYFLLEQGLKALLHECKCETKKIHQLSTLFELLPDKQKNILRLYYSDFLKTFSGLSLGKLDKVDDYLNNLDGDSRGHLDWRYFLIEERPEERLPIANINVIHEIVYAIYIAHMLISDTRYKPEQFTYSFRLFEERRNVYSTWYQHRMNLSSWDDQENRIEKLYGPDYSGRLDYTIIKGRKIYYFFSTISDKFSSKYPVYDMWSKFQEFERNKAHTNDGNLADSSERFQERLPKHLMF